MITDGQHRVSASPPKLGNCFFCLKDRFCDVVALPPATVANFKETVAHDPLLMEVVNRVAKMQFVCCAECQKDQVKLSEAIVDFIFQQRMIEKLKRAK